MLTKTKTWNYISTEVQLNQVLIDLEDYCQIFYKKSRKPKLSVDLETYSKTGRHKPILLQDGTYESEVRLLSIGLDPSVEDVQWLIDVRIFGYERLAHLFRPYLEKCLIIGQGLKFDAEHLIERFNIWMGFPRCTLLLAQLISAGDKYNKSLEKRDFKLHSQYKYYLDWGWFTEHTGKTPEEYSFFKAKMQKSDWGAAILDNDQLQYAADDIQLVHYLYKAQVEELERVIAKYNKSGLRHTYRIECTAINEFAVMDIVGVEPDIRYYDEEVIPYLEGYIEDSENELMVFPEFWEEVENLTTQVKLMDGSIIKVQSRKLSIPYCKFINVNGKATAAGPGQLQRALSRAGIDCPNAQKETFEELLYDPDNANSYTQKQKHILTKVLQYIKAKSMLTKYGRNLYSGEKSCLYDDGCFHPDTFQMGGEENGVDTQRTSAKKPAYQTIPSGTDDFLGDGKKIGKVLREPYKARQGKKLIVADFSNQEGRIATQVTNDQYLISVFREGRDQHAETGKDIFGLDYLPLKGSPERQAGKTGFLGHIYQQGWKGMQAKVYEDTKCQLWIPDEQAKEMKKKLRVRFAGITKKAEELKNKIVKSLEPYPTLKAFENRKPIYVGFTELKYNKDKLKDIMEFDGSDTMIPITRMRKWCLYIDQERRIKRVRKGLRDFIIKKRSLKKLAKLFNSKLIEDSEGNKLKPNVMIFSPLKVNNLIRKVRPVDTLHKDYKVKNEESGKFETWNNQRNKRIAAISREAFNFLMQPEGSTIIKLSMIGIGKEFRKRGWSYRDVSIILEVHDEIIVEAKDEYVEEAAAITKRVMETVIQSVVTVVDAPVEVGVGLSWADAK